MLGGAAVTNDVHTAVLAAVAAAFLVAGLLILLNKPGWLPFQERSAQLSMLTALSSLQLAWATLVTDEHAPTWLLGGGGCAAAVPGVAAAAAAAAAARKRRSTTISISSAISRAISSGSRLSCHSVDARALPAPRPQPAMWR